MGDATGAGPARRASLGWIALWLICGLALRIWAPGADPPLVLSASNAEVMDGPWYLAEAVDGAWGRAAHVPPQYRMPLITLTARPFFLGGVSLKRVQLWTASWGAVWILCSAWAAWLAYGRRAASWAAALTAFAFIAVGYGRTPVVYGPLAAGMAGVLALLALGLARPRWQPMAWIALGTLAVGVKDTAIVGFGALVVGALAASRRPWRAALLGAIALGVLAGLAWVVAPHRVALLLGKARGYFGDAGAVAVLKRSLRGGFASGLLPKSIGIGLLAWLAVASGPGSRSPEQRGVRRAFTLAACVLWVSWLVVFGAFTFREPAVGGRVPPPPLRYFVPALAPAIVLAAGWFGRLAEGRAIRPLVGMRPAVAALWAGLGAYWFLGAGLLRVWEALGLRAQSAPRWLLWIGSAVGLGTLAFGFAVLGAVLARRGQASGAPRPPGSRRWLVVVCAVLAFAPELPLLAEALARPGWTLYEANALTRQLLAPGARAMGTWAHALTYTHPAVERFLPPERIAAMPAVAERARITHFIIDEGWMPQIAAAFARHGAPLVGLARVEIRGHPVVISRTAWAERTGYVPSALEREIERRRRLRGPGR